MLPNDMLTEVRRTWRLVSANPDRMADAFYRNLFAMVPSSRHLFSKTDMQAQGSKLVATFDKIVANADNFSDLAESLQALGRRHQGYGVSDEHYAGVAAALIEGLREVLGPEFTLETRLAWTAALGLVTREMRSKAPAPPLSQ